jgi:hypothetical protein
MEGITIETATARTRLYRRDLPGVGFVAIDMAELSTDEAAEGDTQARTAIRISVERRASEERRTGHAPPVVAEFIGDHSAPEVGELYRMAADNVALARALLEWQGRQPRGVRAD